MLELVSDWLDCIHIDWIHLIKHLIIWLSGILLGWMLSKISSCYNILKIRLDQELPKKYMIMGGKGKDSWLAFNAQTPWEVLEAYGVYLVWRYLGKGMPLEKHSVKRLKKIGLTWFIIMLVLCIVGTFVTIYYTIELTELTANASRTK